MNMTKTQYKLLNLLLVVILAYLGTKTVAKFINNTDGIATSQATTTPNAQTNIKQTVPAIDQTNIFAPPQANTADIVPVNTNHQFSHLTLKGISAGHPKVARAIILNTQDDVTALYKIGDTISDATLTAISRKGIELQYLQNKYYITLNHTSNLTPSENVLNDNAQSKQSPRGSNTFESLLRQSELTPYTLDGKTMGLKITQIDNHPIALMAGIKDNDVIQSLNGQLFDSKQKAYQVFQKAKHQENIKISLLRDGQPETITFPK